MLICFHWFALKVSIHFLCSQYVAVFFLYYYIIAFSLCADFTTFSTCTVFFSAIGVHTVLNFYAHSDARKGIWVLLYCWSGSFFAVF